MLIFPLASTAKLGLENPVADDSGSIVNGLVKFAILNSL
jgi:hypothetical protein